MSANINTILVLGATSGIGEQFARRFHAQGKNVIAAGRRIERLEGLKKDLPGLEILQFDIEDLSSISTKLNTVIRDFPSLDSVFLVSGKLEMFDFKDPSSSSDESIISEITTNFTAPMLISRTIIPYLLSLNKPATFMTVSSGLAFVPFPMWPVYNSTKAAIHAFSVALRSQLDGTNVTVIELVPPKVATELDKKYRDANAALEGGDDTEEQAHAAMPLEEYMDTAMAGLEWKDGKAPREVAVGFAELGVRAWRDAFQPILDSLDMKG